MAEIHDLYPDSFRRLSLSGGYFPRLKRNGSGPSMHAMGAAVDFNAGTMPMTDSTHQTIADVPDWYRPVVATFEKHGWKWGASFGDPMHFQYGTGY
jgi:hypothetical protein